MGHRQKQIVRWSVLAVIILLLGLYLVRIDYTLVGAYLYKMRWVVPAVILITGLAYLLATMAWRQSFFAVEDLPPDFGRLYMIRHLGEVLTLINPTNIIAGEYAKVFLLEKAGVSSKAGLTSILISRGLIILSYLFLFVAVLVLFLCQKNVFEVNTVLMVLLVALVALVLFAYLLLSQKLLLYHIVRTIMKRWERAHNWIAGLMEINVWIVRFYQRRKLHFTAAFGLSILHWLVGTLEFYFILNGLGLEVSYLDAIVMEMGVMAFKSAGSFVPGQVGIEEYGNLVLLDLIGVPGSEIWLTVSIMRRARQLIWLGIGLIFLGITFRPIRWKYSS